MNAERKSEIRSGSVVRHLDQLERGVGVVKDIDEYDMAFVRWLGDGSDPTYPKQWSTNRDMLRLA